MPCDWLPGFASVHWADFDLVFALPWHCVVRTFMCVRAYVCMCGYETTYTPLCIFFFLINHYSYSDYLAYDERPHLHVGYLFPEPVSTPLPFEYMKGD